MLYEGRCNILTRGEPGGSLIECISYPTLNADSDLDAWKMLVEHAKRDYTDLRNSEGVIGINICLTRGRKVDFSPFVSQLGEFLSDEERLRLDVREKELFLVERK